MTTGSARPLRVLAAMLVAAVGLLWPGPAASQSPPSEPPPVQTPEPGSDVPAAVVPRVPAPVAQPVDPVPVDRPIAPPADPVAAQAYAVLETHCARCHQGGRLKRPAPAAGFGNILRLDELARDPVLVQPGNPDASRLYTAMLRGWMPYDVHHDPAGASEPTAAQIDAVRSWIARLEPVPACRDRRPVTAERHAESLTRVAQAAGWVAGRMRFVSLAHLYNACATPRQMFAYRQAVVRLFNSLSWKPGPVIVETVDEARTLLRIDLDSLGWVPQHWERILGAGPNVPGYLLQLPAAVTEPFGTARPIVRGDWLASTVLRAPLYYDLLGLPGLDSEIARILQIDAEALRRGTGALRGGIKPSQFARHGRLVERLGLRNRALWTAFDALVTEGRRDLSELAQGPPTAVPPHDAALSVFLLPNGFPAFFATNPVGDRMDRVPAPIVRGGIAARTGVRVGLDCMGCHGPGVALGLGPATLTGDLARAAGLDREVVREAQLGAGLEPDYTLDGVDSLVALARQFTRPISARRAAAELGIAQADFVDRLAGASGPAGLMARRLIAGLVPRDAFESGQGDLLAALGAGQPSALPVPTPVVDPPDPGPGLMLLADKPVYKVGDAVTIVVRAHADCHLTVINVDQRGRGTVIYPSDFETGNLLLAGRELTLPAKDAPYRLRVKTPGRESIVAICNAAGTTVDGIRHDFERQRFTDLGDYAVFVRQAVAADAEARQRAKAGQPPQPEPKAKGRRRIRERPEPVATKPPEPGQITHTAITIEVK